MAQRGPLIDSIWPSSLRPLIAGRAALGPAKETAESAQAGEAQPLGECVSVRSDWRKYVQTRSSRARPLIAWKVVPLIVGAATVSGTLSRANQLQVAGALA